jgi:predicted RNA-binding Zn-ribbon protein involved in translation (DUF1610 family)
MGKTIKMCPQCYSALEQGDSNYDYDSGVTNYECKECGWQGTHDDIVEDDEDKVVEWCSHCDTEVLLEPNLSVQKCPNCGKKIIPCCLCDMDNADCANCKLAKECEDKTTLSSSKTTRIEGKDLKQILEICASYIEGVDNESKLQYFREFVKTGLFHDAMGKPLYAIHSADYVDVVTDY